MRPFLPFRPSLLPLPAVMVLSLSGWAVAQPLVVTKKTSITTISGSRFFVAEYQRAPGATLSVEVSPDLVSWGVPGVGGRPAVVATISPTDSQTTVMRINQPVTSLTRHFIRARGHRARMDYDRNGTGDFVVVRNVGGGPSGAITWFINHNNGTTATVDHGIASDKFTPGDFDGDGFSDPAVRTAAGEFRIRQSGGGGIRSVTLPSDGFAVCADYDGDGKTDPAIFRSVNTSCEYSYIGSLANPSGNVTTVSIANTSGFPNPGDYDGDGKSDFCVQMNGGGGVANFVIRLSSNGSTVTIPFGTPTDTVTSGDFDGDGKADLVAMRAVSGNLNWFIREADGGGTGATPIVLGVSATDTAAPGDYDGDGKMDIAVWRPAAGTNAGFFRVRRSSDGLTVNINWGQTGDFPVAKTFVY